jgi:ppGpp synthetase/RelA/SpoT-type nucleotidyltranferase
MNDCELVKILDLYKSKTFAIEQFYKRIINFFTNNPQLILKNKSIIHSIRYRLKDIDHLKEKVQRKESEGKIITCENLFNSITDFAGVRILHLYPSAFKYIHNSILEQIKDDEWYFFENPIAYTWDPEQKKIFEGLSITTKIKESYYTSVHYVLMPREDSEIKCELQVRTLFEEIWGEIDHNINYPTQSGKKSIREQLKVLASLTATGSRLIESINTAIDES